MSAIAELFAEEPDTLGLSDCIACNDLKLEQIVRSTKIENLSILPAGRRISRPTELLDHPRVRAVIREAETKFDWVIIDTAPIHAVSDALLPARHVPYVCLIVRARRTPARAVVRALHKLAETESRPIGLVLNDLPTEGNYYYRYDGQKYGDRPKKKVNLP
jgi:succinoglycan biosynthesis transport protein ExoP